MKPPRLLSLAGLLFCGLMAVRAHAMDSPLEFIHALQDNDYNDMAVEYLRMLAQQPQVPAAVRDVWDLEMSKSLRGAAKHAYNAEDVEKTMAEAQKHLDKFLQEKPNHPEAVSALAWWGGFSMDRALQCLRIARTQTDKDQQAKQFEAARAALEEARPRLKQAAEKFGARLSSLRPAQAPSPKRLTGAEQAALAERQELRLKWMDARFQGAMIDYYSAQTYPDPKDDKRRSALKTAAKALDDIYQTNRTDAESQLGLMVALYAHLWHGKTVEELGDLRTAADIYDEVLGAAPEGKDARSAGGLEGLFAQAEQFRLMLLVKQKRTEEFFAEAQQWLDYYKKTKTEQTEGYQAIALELAKAKVARAGSAAPTEKTRLTNEAKRALSEISRGRSQYQQDAILLLRQLTKAGGDAEAKTFEEAVALADAALEGSRWDEAIPHYQRALELADTGKARDAKQVTAVHESLAHAQWMVARHLFTQGKMEECIRAAGEIVQKQPETAAAPMAASLAVSASLNLYAAAPADKRPAAMDRLTKIAKLTIDKWPAKPEADDARLALGQASLATGNADEALAVFEKVNPKSERYPGAAYLAGQTYWRRYMTEKLKPADQRNAPQMAADREKAVQRVTTSLDAQRKAAEPGKLMPKQLVETQLLMADICFEAGQMQQAAALVQPLVDAVKGSKPESLDLLTLRIFVRAGRTCLALGELQKASDVSMTLGETGPDISDVNGVLLEFAVALDNERKAAEAALTDATARSDAKAAEDAKTRLQSARDLLGKLLKKLAAREKFSLTGMVFVADTCGAAGLSDEASRQYQKILKRVESDAALAKDKAAAKAITRTRAQLIGLLRQQGKFEEALQQAKALVTAHPRALEPLMEQGRILQAWSQQEPSHYEEAIAHWSKLRATLQRLQKKPPEYYEVVYYVALALHDQAAKTTDRQAAQQKAKQAEQLLKSTLVLSPKLSGPNMVAQYNAVLAKVIAMQGRKPEAAAKKTEGASKKPNK